MKNIFITGANRGLGLEFVKQLSGLDTQIIAACQNPHKADELQQLIRKRKNISVFSLDVTNDAAIFALAEQLRSQPIDWLINNAGFGGNMGVFSDSMERANFLNVFNINSLSPLKIAHAFLPHLCQGQDKLIINISSQMGSISDNQDGGSYAYRASKAALNAVMRSFALDVLNKNIKVILLHPGWAKTDMGGVNALINVQTSVSGMLAVIEKYKQNSHAEVLRTFNDTTLGW